MVWKSVSPDYPEPRTPQQDRPTAARKPAKPRHCTQCGRLCSLEFSFCPGCGQAVAARECDPRKVCACGMTFGRKDRFCASCGAPRPAA